MNDSSLDVSLQQTYQRNTKETLAKHFQKRGQYWFNRSPHVWDQFYHLFVQVHRAEHLGGAEKTSLGRLSEAFGWFSRKDGFCGRWHGFKWFHNMNSYYCIIQKDSCCQNKLERARVENGRVHDTLCHCTAQEVLLRFMMVRASSWK